MDAPTFFLTGGSRELDAKIDRCAQELSKPWPFECIGPAKVLVAVFKNGSGIPRFCEQLMEVLHTLASKEELTFEAVIVNFAKT